jgi:hypothetical protein
LEGVSQSLKPKEQRKPLAQAKRGSDKLDFGEGEKRKHVFARIRASIGELPRPAKDPKKGIYSVELLERVTEKRSELAAKIHREMQRIHQTLKIVSEIPQNAEAVSRLYPGEKLHYLQEKIIAAHKLAAQLADSTHPLVFPSLLRPEHASKLQKFTEDYEVLHATVVEVDMGMHELIESLPQKRDKRKDAPVPMLVREYGNDVIAPIIDSARRLRKSVVPRIVRYKALQEELLTVQKESTTADHMLNEIALTRRCIEALSIHANSLEKRVKKASDIEKLIAHVAAYVVYGEDKLMEIKGLLKKKVLAEALRKDLLEYLSSLPTTKKNGKPKKSLTKSERRALVRIIRSECERLSELGDFIDGVTKKIYSSSTIKERRLVRANSAHRPQALHARPTPTRAK